MPNWYFLSNTWLVSSHPDVLKPCVEKIYYHCVSVKLQSNGIPSGITLVKLSCTSTHVNLKLKGILYWNCLVDWVNLYWYWGESQYTTTLAGVTFSHVMSYGLCIHRGQGACIIQYFSLFYTLGYYQVGAMVMWKALVFMVLLKTFMQLKMTEYYLPTWRLDPIMGSYYIHWTRSYWWLPQ